MRRFRALVCRGPECGDRRGSRAVYDALRAALGEHGLRDACEVGWQSCFGRCTQGPNVLVREITTPSPDPPATALYNGVSVETVVVVVQEHVGRGEIVRSLIASPTRPGVP